MVMFFSLDPPIRVPIHRFEELQVEGKPHVRDGHLPRLHRHPRPRGPEYYVFVVLEGCQLHRARTFLLLRLLPRAECRRRVCVQASPLIPSHPNNKDTVPFSSDSRARIMCLCRSYINQAKVIQVSSQINCQKMNSSFEKEDIRVVLSEGFMYEYKGGIRLSLPSTQP